MQPCVTLAYDLLPKSFMQSCFASMDISQVEGIGMYV